MKSVSTHAFAFKYSRHSIGFFLSAVLWTSVPAFSITNIENARPGPPPEGWSGNLELGFSGKSGNQKEANYHTAGKITWRSGQNTAFAIAERAYGKTSGVKDTDETFTHIRWVHAYTPTLAGEAFVQWQQNAFNNLESRSLVGAGGRFHLVNQPDVLSLSLGLGAFREKEELDLGIYEEVNWAWRANTYLAYRHQINEQLRLVNTLYYQPNADDFADYRVLFDVGFLVAISERLSIALNYSLNHNSEPAVNLEADPPINKHKTNSQYSTSITYSF